MLRHLAGLLAGIALAPVLWIAVAWSADLLPRITEGDVTVTTVLSVVVLCLVGAVCAYLVASRLSPMVAGSGGALLTALCLWPIVHPGSMEPALSWLAPDSFLYPTGTGPAVALPLGTLLLFSTMMPVRWRSANDAGLPSPGRSAAGTGGDRQPEPVRDGRPLDSPWEDGGPVGDTVPNAVPDTPPAPEPVPDNGFGDGFDDGFDDDPNKTTTPFRRGANGSHPVGPSAEDRTETDAARSPRGDARGKPGPFRKRRR